MNPARPKPQRRDGPLLYGAIFLMFCPIGVLLMMVQPEPLGWLAAIVSGAFSGLMSVGWAHTFIRKRWWLIAVLAIAPFTVNPAIFWLMARTGLLEVGTGPTPQVRLVILAVMCVAFTAIGFILSVMHLRRTEGASARAHAELDLARRVHQTLVPPIALQTPVAEVYGRSLASSAMGGDLIDAVAQDSRVDVLVGDVSGHGVGAGVVMAMLKSCIRMRLSASTSLDQVLADANRVLADLTAPEMFATCVALRLTRGGGRLEFALAGHLPIFHYHAAERRWSRHPNESLPLGIDHAEHYAAGSTTTAPGDILALFTDGLMEVQDSAGRELGLERFAEILYRSLRPSLAAMHDAITAAVAAHGRALDDQSLVLVRCA